MADTETRLRDAQCALHHLELRIEQYQFHLAEIGAHPQELDRGRMVLEALRQELLTQRKYVELLTIAHFRNNGSGASEVA